MSPARPLRDPAAVRIPRPEKELFGDGITKADLAAHYERVAEAMLPHLEDRPVNLERYPDGIGGARIIQQHTPEHFPDWIGRARVAKAGGSVTHVVVRDAATLVYLAGQACITIHAWLSRADRPERPDRLIVDLDPPDGVTPDALRAAARRIADLLGECGLRPFAMTTGSRGYHLVAPIQRRSPVDSVRDLARDIARVAVARDPDTLTAEHRKAARGGRIFVDVMRNTYAQTAVAPYSVRARPGAPVATPLALEELDDGATRPDRWTIATVGGRLARDGDPWSEIAAHAAPLGPARKALPGLLREAGL